MSLENILKGVKELFPKKALDLDSFTQIIKTWRSKKFSVLFKLFPGHRKKESKSSPSSCFVLFLKKLT